MQYVQIKTIPMKSMLLKFALFYVFVALFHSYSGAQQKPLQNWNSVGITIPTGKKTDFRFNELGSFIPSNGYSLLFAQTMAAISYDVTKHFSLKFGDALNYIPGSTNSLRNRIFVKGTIDNKFSEVLKAEHSLQFELHDKNETRYHERIIFINRLSLRHRFSPLNLRPSLSYSLYYNIGGKTVQYFDKVGDPTVAQTPDGFHRGRFYAMLNSKISKHFQLNLYFMNQKEFNFLAPQNKQINVYNPSTGKLSRPYDNFNALGLSLQYSL